MAAICLGALAFLPIHPVTALLCSFSNTCSHEPGWFEAISQRSTIAVLTCITFYALLDAASPLALLHYQWEAGLQNKTKGEKLIPLLWIGLLLLSGYFALTWRTTELTFVEAKSRPGFRELVLRGGGLSAPQLLTIGLPDPESNGETAEKIEPDKLCASLFYDASSPRAGREGTVRIATFFDYRCSYCRTLTKILSELQKHGKFQVTYKEWPVLGDSSILAARAALAAAKQGRYQEFHMKLMESRLIPTPHLIEALAKSLNLDVPRLLQDMNGKDISGAIERSASLASEFEFSGTPALVVGRTIVRGAIPRAQLEKLIELEAVSVPKYDC